MLTAAVAAAAASTATAQGLGVYVGYADSSRAGATQFPTPFGPAPGITYEGCAGTGCTLDSGAVRIVNTGFNPVTIDSTTVSFEATGFATYTCDNWPHDVTIPGGGQLILAQTATTAVGGCPPGSGSFDSSDIGPGGNTAYSGCSNDHVTPFVNVTVGGVTTSYKDAGQVLNTGGIDVASCPPSTNESIQWTKIGSPACPTATLKLTPATQLDATGDKATVIANLSNSCGQPLSGVQVDFSGTGVNAPISGSATTLNNGDAVFQYVGTHTGTDTLQASVTNLAGSIDSNTVTVNWGTLERNGHFSCSASALNLLGAQTVVANAKDDPCATASKSLVSLGSLASVLSASTALNAGALPALGDAAVSDASVAGVHIGAVPGHSIDVSAVSSQAKVECGPNGLGGLFPVLSSAGSVAKITIDGKATTIGAGPLKLSIGSLATVWLNRTIRTGTDVTRRAVEVDLLGKPVAIVAQSHVDISGHPCGTVLVP